MNNKGILVVFSGFAGSGKGTIMKELISKYPSRYALSVSATTRAPREGEEEGISYFFKTVEEFENLISSGQMLEYANYVGNYYGTPKAYVEKKLEEGFDVILEIETQGALKVKEQYPDTVLIFVTPPDADTLYNRLKGRGTEDDATIAKRMKQAYTESKVMSKYDYLVINDQIDVAVEEVNQLISNEHHKISRNIEYVKSFENQLQSYEKGV